MPKPKKALTLDQLQHLQANLPVVCPSLVVTVDGQRLAVPDMLPMISQLIAAEQVVPQAKAEWLDAIHDLAKLQASKGQVLRQVCAVIELMYKTDFVSLGLLGITPRKERHPLTVEQKLAAAEKLRATRKARGTTSKKQRSKIKGSVTGVVIAPVTRSGPE